MFCMDCESEIKMYYYYYYYYSSTPFVLFDHPYYLIRFISVCFLFIRSYLLSHISFWMADENAIWVIPHQITHGPT